MICAGRSLALCGGALVLLVGCGDDPPPPSPPLPAGFLYGASIAGFQADMGCPTLDPEACEDRNSDWFRFATSEATRSSPSAHLSGQSPSDGPGHWELYEHDLDLLRDELRGNAFRFSIEWSRIFPTSTIGVPDAELAAMADPAALAHYRAVLAACRARGITPLVTLNHYTLPTWIHDGVGCHLEPESCAPRGWLDREVTVREIARFAGFVAAELGDEIDLWATLNEPFAVLLPGYILPSDERSNPPARTFALADARAVMVALIEAHARMYDAIKAADAGDVDGDGVASQVGVVYAMAPAVPADPTSADDVRAAENLFYLWNMAYLNAVARGDLDEDLDGIAEHRVDLADRMDYVGINYYTRITVSGSPTPALAELSPLTTFNPVTLQLWEDYPRGIYEMAQVIEREYDLPTIITENGVPDPADDGTGPSYLARHLAWVARAVEDGADVRGYFYWTLMDNFEWNHGMDVRMGLWAVDPADPAKTRTPRQTVATYRAIIDAGRIPDDVRDAYPLEE